MIVTKKICDGCGKEHRGERCWARVSYEFRHCRDFVASPTYGSGTCDYCQVCWNKMVEAVKK